MITPIRAKLICFSILLKIIEPPVPWVSQSPDHITHLKLSLSLPYSTLEHTSFVFAKHL